MDRSDSPGLFGDHDSFDPGSFSDLFPEAEEVDPVDDLFTWKPGVLPTEHSSEASHLTDEMIDAALDAADETLLALDTVEANLDWDRATDGCTCTVVPYSGRLSESRPAEREARFEKTHVSLCAHCLNQLTREGVN